MKTIALVPAAGLGKRLGLKTKKPFIPLGGRPLVTYAIKALEDSTTIDGIIVAVERSCITRFKKIAKRYGFKKILKVVPGGKTRFESVKSCLKFIESAFDIVLIHDGARPFLKKDMISDCVAVAARYGGCIKAVPENDTLKLAEGKGLKIRRTLSRRCVWRAQTPQAFKAKIIKRAYGLGAAASATDDASLVEKSGVKVRISPGSYGNIKITTRDDLYLAEALLRKG
jgi:2-C-methyl-D-erythritol 4-phosphate cytidylyltransferase